MNTFILILIFLNAHGDIRVAHDGAPGARVMTQEVCESRAQELIQEGKKYFPWIKAGCVPVPNPDGVDDLPAPAPMPERPTKMPDRT